MIKESVVFFAPALFTRSVFKGECDVGKINAQSTMLHESTSCQVESFIKAIVFNCSNQILL